MTKEPEWTPTHYVRFDPHGDESAKALDLMLWGSKEYFSKESWDAKAPPDFLVDEMTKTYVVSGRITAKYPERHFEIWPR